MNAEFKVSVITFVCLMSSFLFLFGEREEWMLKIDCTHQVRMRQYLCQEVVDEIDFSLCKLCSTLCRFSCRFFRKYLFGI